MKAKLVALLLLIPLMAHAKPIPHTVKIVSAKTFINHNVYLYGGPARLEVSMIIEDGGTYYHVARTAPVGSHVFDWLHANNTVTARVGKSKIDIQHDGKWTWYRIQEQGSLDALKQQ